MPISLTLQAEIIKKYVLDYLESKGLECNVSKRRGVFYECSVSNGLIGFFAADRDKQFVFLVTDSGKRNWATKEGFDFASNEYLKLGIIIYLEDEISFVRFLAGEKNYKRLNLDSK